ASVSICSWDADDFRKNWDAGHVESPHKEGSMKKALIWGTGLAFVLVAACSSSNSPDGIMKDTLAMMNDMTSVLASIKDEASAKAASQKLQDRGKKGEEIKKRGEALKIQKDQEESLKKKYEPQLKEATEKLMKETFRVATVPGAAEAMKAMQPKKG